MASRFMIRAFAAGLLAAVAAGGASAQSGALTLEQAQRLAVERSPTLRGAAARADAGGAGRTEAWGRLLPSVRLSAGLDRTGVLQRTATDPITGGIIALPDSLIEDRESFGTSARLSLDWTVFDGGQTWLAIRGADAEADALDRMLVAARVRARAGATVAYLDALETAAQAQVREAEAGRARALLDAAEARFRTGAAPEIDVLQASLALNEADLALEDARIAAAAARAGLMEYLGGDLDRRDFEAVELVAPADTAARSVAGALDDVAACAVNASPELDGLRARVESAERERAATRWSALPSIGIGATMMRTEYGQTREAMTLDPRNAQVYYHLDLSWRPLERPGAWLAGRRRADAGLDEAAAALDARRAAMAREAETSIGELRRARVAQERAGLNVRLAARQREQAAERYRLGLAPITETIQAESLARAAERQAIAARFAWLRALAGLELATGTEAGACM